jgi:ubiquinone/menaquinone biosynthesis C-methylase UbiE
MSCDEVTPVIVGDYNHMPFPAECFDEAHGSCYLEEVPQWSELFRVLRPGATATLSACCEAYASERAMFAEVIGAGFIITEYPAWYQDDDQGWYDAPMVVYKPM